MVNNRVDSTTKLIMLLANILGADEKFTAPNTQQYKKNIFLSLTLQLFLINIYFSIKYPQEKYQNDLSSWYLKRSKNIARKGQHHDFLDKFNIFKHSIDGNFFLFIKTISISDYWLNQNVITSLENQSKVFQIIEDVSHLLLAKCDHKFPKIKKHLVLYLHIGKSMIDTTTYLIELQDNGDIQKFLSSYSLYKKLELLMRIKIEFRSILDYKSFLVLIDLFRQIPINITKSFIKVYYLGVITQINMPILLKKSRYYKQQLSLEDLTKIFYDTSKTYVLLK